MDFLPEEFDEILNIFRGETEEIIQKMNNNLLQLENAPDNKDLLVYLFRDAHSLKGAARMIGFNNIQRLAHKVEDVLGLAKENKIKTTKNISDSLYKAIDLISELIQESVKQKKEFYKDEIQHQIDYIDSLIQNYQPETISPSFVEPTPQRQNQFTKTTNKNTKDFSKKVPTINALISEFYLLLNNIKQNNDTSYIETLFDVIKQLNEIFDETTYYDIKNDVKNISSKINFVIQNSKILTPEEITDIEQKLVNIINQLNCIYSEQNIENLNLKKILKGKNIEIDKAETDSIEDEYIQENNSNEKTTSDNSAMLEFVNKIEFLKTEINNLENNLTQIPELVNATTSIIEITKNKGVIQILNKIEEIFNIIKNLNTLPDKEVINILKQSISIIEKMTFDSDGDSDDVSLVLQRLDIIKQMLDLNTAINPLKNLSSTLDESTLPVKKAQDFFNSFETTSIRTLRVDSKKLDTLVNQVGELIIARIKQKKNKAELEKIIDEITELKNFNSKSQSFIKFYDRKYMNSPSEFSYATFSIFSKQIFSLLQESSTKMLKLSNKILSLQKSVDEEDTKQNLIISKLENMVKNVRVLPLATIFHMFPRMIRDIGQATGKDIELFISGSETSADKKVIEEIKAPLIHIIRNSIDHGIETPEERIAAGKSPKGKIYLIAKNKQNKIIIEIHDDGRGIDLQKIANRAIEKGLITKKEADFLSAEQIMNIIFWPGFSTEQVVTELSGRGVGLDIVQTKINQLNGNVKVYSIPEQGTKITIELPISMSTLKAFIVEASNQLFALSMNLIKNVMWINEKDIYKRNSTKTILIDNKNVNIFYLSELMNLPPSEKYNDNKLTVVLLEIENNLLGIIVDRILGDQNILQKKLDPPIVKLKNISGITTLANGEVCLILNLVELYKNTYTPVETPLLTRPKNKINTKENKDYHILIVDDSITTRKLLQTILENKDYSYEMVQNPKEAFEVLYKQDFDLILSDMEMPEMDGKMFVQELKAHPKFKNIPVVMISSYEKENLKEEIPEAVEYIKKSEFNQNKFLSIIENIMKNGTNKR